MHVAPEIFSRLHHACWYAHGLQLTHDLVGGLFAGPGTDAVIEFVMALPASCSGHQAGLIGPRLTPDERGQGAPLGLSGAANDAPGLMPRAEIAALRYRIGISVASGCRHRARGKVVQIG